LIELIGKVIKVGKTSIVVKVNVFLEEMYADKRIEAVSGIFTFVAIGDDKKPVKIITDV